MRIHSFLLVSAALLVQGAAHAQNSDFAVLLGVTWPEGKIVSGPGTYVKGSVGGDIQFNYAFQAVQRVVDLYVEFPMVIAGRDTGLTTAGMVSESAGVDFYFTPGVRLKFSPESRVSLYGAAGGGLASLGQLNVLTTNRSVTLSTGRVTTGAFDFGGGFDLRITRLLSFRIEGRDFVTRAGLGGSAGMHHGLVNFGIAFHF